MATVWTWPDAVVAFKDRVRVAKAACSTGTDAATAAPGDGLDLRGLGSVGVHVEAGGAMLAGNLQAYLLNPATGQWNRAPALDLAVQAIAAQGYPGLALNGETGRLQLVANGLGVACSIYLIGVPRAPAGAGG